MNESKKYSCFLLWHKSPCCCVYCFRQREPSGSPVPQSYSSARLSQDTQLWEDSVVIVKLSACPGLSLDLQNGHKAGALRFYNSHPAPHCHLSLFYGPHSIIYHYLNHSYSFIFALLFIYHLSSVDCKPRASKDFVLLTTVSPCLQCAWHMVGAQLKSTGC